MNKLDILILIIIGLAGFSCFITGFVRSTIGLMAIGGGIFIAGQLWRHLAPLLNNFVKHETAAKWLSILAIIAIASIAIDLLLMKIQKIAEKGVLGWINNLIGASFGILIASLFLGMILLLLTQNGNDFLKNSIDNSRFAKPLVAFAKHTIGMVKKSIVQNNNLPDVYSIVTEKELETEFPPKTRFLRLCHNYLKPIFSMASWQRTQYVA
ncbi:CvpA family protein [bacterium]|nr:CvpA family protein [bacterium]